MEEDLLVLKFFVPLTKTVQQTYLWICLLDSQFGYTSKVVQKLVYQSLGNCKEIFDRKSTSGDFGKRQPSIG